MSDTVKGDMDEYLRDIYGLVQFKRKNTDDGETSKWALRRMERLLADYLGYPKEDTMPDLTALFLVESVTTYRGKDVAFLTPVHPDGLAGGVDLEAVSDEEFNEWYDPLLPDFEMVHLERDSEVRQGPGISATSGKSGFKVRIPDGVAWSPGTVVQFGIEAVAREDYLTEPLRDMAETA